MKNDKYSNFIEELGIILRVNFLRWRYWDKAPMFFDCSCITCDDIQFVWFYIVVKSYEKEEENNDDPSNLLELNSSKYFDETTDTSAFMPPLSVGVYHFPSQPRPITN